MTITHEFSTTDTLRTHDLLELFDTVTGYGIDRYSREELAKLDSNDDARHVTTANTANEIIERYIYDRYTQLNGKSPKTEKQRNSIVQTDGFLSNATYCRDDILTMLDDKTVQRSLKQQFHNRTTLIQGVYIPTAVADTHPIDPANQEMEDYFL